MKVKAVAILALPGALGFSNNFEPPRAIGQQKSVVTLAKPPLPLTNFQRRLQSQTRGIQQGSANDKPLATGQTRLQSMILMAIPILESWTITSRGEASGVVKNHPDPNISNGELLTTSKLATIRGQVKEGATVVTASGSKYKLGKQRGEVAATSFWGSFAMGKSKTPKKPSPPSEKPKWGATRAATLDQWRITVRGEVKGKVTNYPDASIPNGDTITTSKIKEDRNSLVEGQIITTSSGSKYVLGAKKSGFDPFSGASSPSAVARGGTYGSKSQRLQDSNGNTPPVRAPAPPAAPFNIFGTFEMRGRSKSKSRPVDDKKSTESISAAGSSWGSFGVSNRATSPPPSQTNRSAVKQEAARIANLRDLKIKYGVNGKTVGNGKYLLCGKPQRSTSGKSNIWSAYRANRDGLPTGEKLTIKVSNNFDSMSRESDNYNRVCTGLFPGRFVEKSDFLINTDGNPSAEFKTSCALIIESGRKDLKAILAERGGRGFEGRAMRDAAIASLQCVQAMHSSGIVWTDMKTENFVIVSDEIGDNGYLPGVKGIDLESAMPRGSNPVDFSPEACPPEFAAAFISGEGLSFTLDYSYDIWSYGMMLYELTTGRSYFGNKTPAQITKSLQYGDSFQTDVSLVTDAKLRDCIQQCLQANPRKRPGINQLLLHPYFLSSGIGSFSF